MTDRTSTTSLPEPEILRPESAVGTFIALTFLLSAGFYTLILASGQLEGGSGRYVTGIMWCPAFAALLTCRIHRIRIALLGWHWAGFQYQSASYLLPASYSLVAYALVWSTSLGSFSPARFLRDSVEAVGIDAIPPWAAAGIMFLLSAVYDFIRRCANALGEEIGWRGFLAPQLVATRGFTAASLMTGFIWSIWHYPVLLFADYNLGTPGWYALSCFTAMVIGLSVIYTWFRLKTGSLWTATFLHASHNLFIQGIFTPLTGDTGPTRYAIDEFGFVLPLVIGVTAIWFWRRRDVAMAAWREAQGGNHVTANPRLEPAAAG
jgi:CAAX protease family protein